MPVDPLVKVRNALEETISRNSAAVLDQYEGDIPPGLMLNDWVFTSSWVDPDDGEVYYFTICSNNLAPHAFTGLLYGALGCE